MPSYTSYGNLDDRILRDGDVGFVGFNNRLRPDQLQAGVLADAQNIRLDRNGEAQVRKGVELIEAPFAVGGDVFRLPDDAEINDNETAILPNTIQSGSLTSNVVSLVITAPDSDNADRGENGYDFEVGDEITVSGVGFTTTDPNGVHTLTGVTDGTDIKTLTYALTGANETYTTAVALPEALPFDLTNEGATSVVGVNTTLDQGQVTEVYASSTFSDPADNASQYILIASNLKVVAKNLLNGEVTDIVYPSGETVPPQSDMIQAFNKVFIFRNGQRALEWDGDLSGSFTNVQSGEYTQPVQIVCAAGEFALIENRGIVHQEDGVSIGDTITVVGDKTLSGDQTSGLTIGETFTVAKVFVGGSTTTITAASKLAITGGEFDGLYKITATAAGHGKSVGDPIDIVGFGDDKIDGSRFVAEVDGDDFVFYVPQNPSITISGDETVALAHGFEFFVDPAKTDSHITDGDSLTSTPVFAKRVSVGLGFTHMPAPPFATYHQRRLVMPFRFDVGGTNANPTFTSRNVLDEIIASDILDADTYDQIYGSYRFNAGTADFIVGLHSFSDDTLMVFNRNSIHVVKNTIDLNNSTVQLLTDEVGCLARKSIQQVGNQVIFLSDNGVYGTEFLDEYNLRGTQTPLSEPINETIKRINKDQASKAVSAYFDNRYYLAVPLDDALENNALLIYNFLNKQWESIDTVNSDSWDLENLLVAGDGSQRGLYCINKLGGIHQIDSNQRLGGFDRIVTAIGEESTTIPIDASIRTRQFNYGTLERKKFKELEIHAESEDLVYSSDFDVLIEVENPDFGPEKITSLSESNGNVNLPAGEDVSIRARMGNRRGYGLQFIINNTEGRPRIRAIQATASDAFRSTQKAI